MKIKYLIFACLLSVSMFGQKCKWVMNPYTGSLDCGPSATTQAYPVAIPNATPVDVLPNVHNQGTSDITVTACFSNTGAKVPDAAITANTLQDGVAGKVRIALSSGTPATCKIAGVGGTQGPTGPPGSAGQKGDLGPQGPKGDPGNAGVQGPTGPQGNAGPAGPQGDAGPRGTQGAPGTVTSASGLILSDSSNAVPGNIALFPPGDSTNALQIIAPATNPQRVAWRFPPGLPAVNQVLMAESVNTGATCPAKDQNGGDTTVPCALITWKYSSQAGATTVHTIAEVPSIAAVTSIADIL